MKKKKNSNGKLPTSKSRIASKKPTPAQAGAWVFLLAFVLITAAALSGHREKPAPMQVVNVVQTPAEARPSELSGADLGLYTMLFAAEARGETARADEMMAQLDNQSLVGYTLARRYLGGKYTANADELRAWLANYSDHPQAPRIARLANARGAKVALAKPEHPLRGDGYTDHLGRSTMPDSWFTALGHWRSGDFKTAGSIFTRLTKDKSLTDWQKSAAYYWAYRADDKRGNDSSAEINLQHAAAYPTTFYGLLAGAQLGEFTLEANAPDVSDALREDKRAVRAALLVELGKIDEAEIELRALYSATPEGERGGIVTLVSELDMPNLQMRLARTPGLSESEQIFAQFPTPYYMVNLHDVMDSGLLMAVARNESGFRDVAQSEAGATGLMQILPSTAKMVERSIAREHLQVASAGGLDSLSERLNDPAMSARYGAQYLGMLARMPAINNNLIHLLVGYNAGPGTVISWKAATRNMKDPLLYIESIPYAETRNYVMQVSAQYWVYQLMMEEKPTALMALAKGQWPMVKVAARSVKT